MSDWRLDERDEPEATDEEVFGPQDRLTVALLRVQDMVNGTHASGLDRRLIREWEDRMEETGDVAEAERFADYLAA